MVIERPPPHPPDPLTHCRVEQSETVVNMVMHQGAKNASDSCQNGKDLYKIRIPAGAVTFEAAAKQANALHSPLLHFESSVSDRVDVISSKHLGAKNASDSCQNGKDLYKIRILAAAVTFEAAAKQANALHFPLLHSVSSVSDRVDFISSKQYYDDLFEVYPSITEREQLSCLTRLHIMP
jgi:hypothetical protein